MDLGTAGRAVALLVVGTLGGAVEANGQSPGQLIEERVHGSALEGNLIGDAATRSVFVYLPPSYATDADRRFPVVYLLHAYGVTPASWVGVEGYEGFHLGQTLDDLFAQEALDEMIVVMPDARNRLGGSWYTNSPATGRWTDFVARELVQYVDRRFRTIASPGGRGIAGQSMGGYGALRIAMWYPDVFSSVLAMSSPNLEQPNVFGLDGIELAYAVSDEQALAGASVVATLLISKAAAFTPDPQNPPFYGRLPYRRGPGGLREDPEVWSTWWQSALVNHIAERGAGLAATTLRLEVGQDDPLRSETENFSAALDEAGVDHELVVFDGGHVQGVRQRLETSLFQFFSGALSPSDSPVEAMVRTERAFSARSVEAGMRQAFVDFLSDSVVLFRPTPAAGIEAVASGPDLDGTLSWEPRWAEMAGSGDLGYTSGPFQIVQDDDVAASGHYLTVWGRSAADEPFEGLLDVGINHANDGNAVSLSIETRPGVGVARDRAHEDLLAMESRFTDVHTAEGAGPALRALALDDARIYREGSPPAQGLRAAEPLLGAEAPREWATAGALVSRDGTLGVTYGVVTGLPEESPPGGFARVWRRVDAGWRIVVDVITGR